MANKIQIRRDTAANWTASNPTLSQGELGYELDSAKLKIGNGTSNWQALDYFAPTQTPQAPVTYNIQADSTSGGANLTLTGSDSSSDSVKLAAGTNVTITRTNANTITIDATGGAGASAFNQISGQIGQSQIPSGQAAVIIPSLLQTVNAGTDGQVLSVDNTGQFKWITVTVGGNLATVATTGNFDDLNHKPVFPTGPLRIYSNIPVGPGSLVEAYQYRIVSVGSSDWTLSGATSNTVGTDFTATNNGNAAGGNGQVIRIGNFAVALTGSYKDLFDAPTTLSAFADDVGYLNTVTLATYVTTSQVEQIVGQQIDAAIATSGTFYQVLQELATASTSTTITDALANRLRVDVNNQGLTLTQKDNAFTNLGLATVAKSGSYNDLVDKPSNFQVSPATQSSLGGIIVGDGLSVDNVGRISVNTATILLSNIAPTTLKGQPDQTAGQLRGGSVNYIYYAKSNFNPSPYVTNVTATSSTNIVTSGASQWLAQIDNAKAGYGSGAWRLYNPTKDTSYAITNIATTSGVAVVTIDNLITYSSSDVYYIQQQDTWARVGLMDDYGAQRSSVSGLNGTNVSGTVNLASGQANGTTATMFTLDCTGVSYGELGISFYDSANQEYYNGTLFIHLYPDNTYIIQPNTAGNKTDKIGIGFTSGANAPFTNPALIKIPVSNTDINVGTNLTQSSCSITNIKYTWLLRTDI